MNIADLLTLDPCFVGTANICLMRHTPKELGDYLITSDVFRFYTAVQKRGKLDRFEYVAAFVVNKSGKTVFRSFYSIVGKASLSNTHYSQIFLLPDIRKHYDALVQEGEYEFYHLEKTDCLAEYDSRLVIDWGRAAIAWFQAYDPLKPKQVLELFPAGHFGEFDDYLSISLTRSEVEYLFDHADSNPLWRSHLSKVSGVYLILDEGTGHQYIGSAYGANGVWGRWSTYRSEPSGGNVRLKELLDSDVYAFKRFRYSLLEVLPGNAVKSEVIAKESLYKKKLGTRVFGLNDN